MSKEKFNKQSQISERERVELEQQIAEILSHVDKRSQSRAELRDAQLEDLNFIKSALEKLGREISPEELARFDEEYRFNNQWDVRLGAEDYSASNPDPETGLRKFYDLKMGKYGNPQIEIEPDLAFSVPADLEYINAQGEQASPQERIGSIICQNEDGTVAHHFSLSSPEAPEFTPTDEGIKIEDREWYLSTLFSKDKNTTFNYEAFYTPRKPEKVNVLRLADLNFAQLAK